MTLSIAYLFSERFATFCKCCKNYYTSNARQESSHWAIEVQPRPWGRKNRISPLMMPSCGRCCNGWRDSRDYYCRIISSFSHPSGHGVLPLRCRRCMHLFRNAAGKMRLQMRVSWPVHLSSWNKLSTTRHWQAGEFYMHFVWDTINLLSPNAKCSSGDVWVSTSSASLKCISFILSK